MLERVERSRPALNAFITVTAESARAEARQAASEIAAGQDRRPLHGVPVAVKDLIATQGTRTTRAALVSQATRVPTRYRSIRPPS